MCVSRPWNAALHVHVREEALAHLVPLAEGPELGANFGRVEAGVRCCWFDSLGVVFKFHICGPLEARLVLLNEQHRVLQESHTARCVCVRHLEIQQ